jgi:predicted RNA binding protein YcfA (HicA-like mRNA interferase family)
MSRLPRISGREAVSAFEQIGFAIRRQHGSQIVMTKAGQLATLSVPDHRELQVGTLRALIRKAGITVGRFQELLRSSFLPSDVHGDGDVKYHLGYSHDVEPAGGRLPIVGRQPLEPVRSRLEGEGYSYGTYEMSPERAAFYRERLSPTLRRTPEASLDFVSEGRRYVRRERRNSPEYIREVEQLALRQDGERAMANACRVVACIPVYTLGEGKIVEHALEQYRKQITNGSVRPEEFEVLLFLNHPKDKLTDIYIAPGAEERVRTGHPESYDTKEVIRQYRARYPELNIHVVEKEFATRPNWGWIIKYAYDTAALRALARKQPVDYDVIILANDIDVRDTSGTYLRQLIETFDKNKKDVAAGRIPRIDGVVGRIDHDTTTYRTWPNFFAVTRFEQFLDAQNRRGYPGRQPHTPPEAEGDGYALRVRRRGEKHTVTQGRNTALRASAYCAIGGANTETDVGADTELGRMVTFARRGVMEKTLHADEYTLSYSPVMWIETDPRRELGMYRKGEPVGRAWSEWEAMNVYGKSFCEQIAGETEELNTGRLEKEFREILKKWGLLANAPSVERALVWLGLAKKDETTGGYIYKDYEIVPDADGELMIEITNLDHLRQHIARWKPKRERIVSAKSRAK